MNVNLRNSFCKIEIALLVAIVILVSTLTFALHNVEKEMEEKEQVAEGVQVVSKDVKPVVALVEPEISDDVMLLAKTICAEAGYENKLDMLLVGNVIMNRLESPWYPDAETISDVIYQKGQYACTWDGNLDRAEPNDLAIDIATRLIGGERLAPKNVIFQSQKSLGDGLWVKVGVHYYCYKNDPS